MGGILPTKFGIQPVVKYEGKLPSMSYASDLTAGYYNTPENDLCDQILEMLKKHNVGFYHTLGDTDDDSGDTDDDSFASKAKRGPYGTFVDNELSPNMKESQQFREFQEFVTEMHCMDSAKITRKQSKQDKHEHGNGKSTKESEISSKSLIPMLNMDLVALDDKLTLEELIGLC
ncbi:hypothetical protein Tco_1237935 [Tanacetum coccineum]